MSDLSTAFYFAWRYFRTRKKVGLISVTSLITIVGVFIGTVAIIATLSVLNGFQQVIIDRAKDIEPNATINTRHLTLAESDSMLQMLRNNPFVKSVLPVLERKIILSGERDQQVALVKGVLPDAYRKSIALDPYLFNGHFLADSVENTDFPEIVIGVGIANYLAVHTGDTLSLISPLDIESWYAPTMKCIVSDIYQVDIFDYDGTLAFIHQADMQYMLDDSSYHSIEIDFKVSTNPDLAISHLLNILPQNIILKTWQDEHKELFAAMQMEKIGTFIVLNLIIVLAGFNLIASLIMLLLEKQWEIGILKSTGISNRTIFRIYMLLGWINGGIGLIGGLLVSVPLLLIQQYRPFITLPQDVYFIKYLPVSVLGLDIVLTILVLAILISLASWYPARRSAKMKPLTAIRVKM